MDLFINDLSFHGQFPDLSGFNDAISRLMHMRAECKKFRRELYCHRNLPFAQITHHHSMAQAVRSLDRDKQAALMQWITRQGPFWEDQRTHSSDEYLECRNEIVTDSALGEAAFRCYKGDNSQVVSVIPSDWDAAPIAARYVQCDGTFCDLAVGNHTEPASLLVVLKSASDPIESWQELSEICSARFSEIVFSSDAFSPLNGHPFSQGVAERIVERLGILQMLKCAVDENGNRTHEGHTLYQDYFMGDKAWFSDSTDEEKRTFKKELTFNHPLAANSQLFCPMHGKVKTPQIRLHFSWPFQHEAPVFVVYVGPKITKR